MFWKSLLRRKTIESIHEDVDSELHGAKLTKTLGLFDLICFGIAAIIGAGIFATIGTAAADGGPAVCLLFILVAFACLCSALCYAEFASSVPISGSAYTYSYVAFGEFIAWIIGWNLLMEYAIGNSVLAFSWSDYFTTFLEGFNIQFAQHWQNDFYTCHEAYKFHELLVMKGFSLDKLVELQQEVARLADTVTPDQLANLSPAKELKLYVDANLGIAPDKLASIQKSLEVWNHAPTIGGWKCIVDLPALLINFLVTCLVYIGIRESKLAANAMVMLKVGVVLLVIAVGIFYVKPANWVPFVPNEMSGVLKGIAAVFFAYIGFDAISTTAEECKNPAKDLPKATLLVLVICTVLYIAIALVLTGMVPYQELRVSDPLAFVFQKYSLNWMAGIVSFSAVIALASVFLVFQMGQPRIWMSMSRDGLLPKAFARIHPRFKTPSFSTIVTGIVVAIPTICLNQQLVTDLCSMGTLFAFMLVSGGVLMLEQDPGRIKHASFRVPYMNGAYFLPIILLLYTFALHPEVHLLGFEGYRPDIELPADHNFFLLFDADHTMAMGVDWKKGPYFVFYLFLLASTVICVVRKWSLIPVLGVLVNLYLVAGLGYMNWIRFIVWCLIGIAVYFVYSYGHSRLAKE